MADIDNIMSVLRQWYYTKRRVKLFFIALDPTVSLFSSCGLKSVVVSLVWLRIISDPLTTRKILIK